jgi:hypothetical protein
VLALVGILSTSTVASAQLIEASAAISPVIVGDPAFGVFQSDEPLEMRIGADLRIRAVSFAGFDFLPLVAYRFGSSDGDAATDSDTHLAIHDLTAGFRLRRSLTSYFAFFAELHGGLAFVRMETTQQNAPSERATHRDSDKTWEVGGGLGLAFGPSVAWLESRGVKKFSFAGELSGGYLARGPSTFAPKLEAGDEFSLPTTPATVWGNLDTSGWYAQMAISIRFL